VIQIKEIEGFKDYLIDEYGNIFNKYTNHKLSQWIDNVGYKQVVLYLDGKRKYKRVHRLVTLAYIDNVDNLKQVNHKDADKTNNNIDNLEWMTNKANTQHAYDSAVYTSTYKVDVVSTHKITNEKLYFRSIREMSNALNINRKSITSILKGTKTTNNYEYHFSYN